MFLATTVTDIKKCQIPAHSTVLLLHLNSYSRTGQELLYYYNFKLTPSPNIPPEDLNMHQGEIWSADRVETTLRTRGWHQHAALWRRSRGSPDAQWFHSGCWTDSTGEGGCRIWGWWLDSSQLTDLIWRLRAPSQVDLLPEDPSHCVAILLSTYFVYL